MLRDRIIGIVHGNIVMVIFDECGTAKSVEIVTGRRLNWAFIWQVGECTEAQAFYFNMLTQFTAQ